MEITNNSIMKEEWEDIIGYNGKYQVSNMGRVRSNAGREQRLMNPWLNTNVRPVVTLTRSRKDQKNFQVHRLVAISFVPNPMDKETVNHKDGDKLNNCATNLEWVTHSENMVHAMQTGLNRRRKRRLSTEDHKQIRRLRELGKTYQQLSTMFSTSVGNVYYILNKNSGSF